MLMTLFAHRNSVVEPVALFQLPPGDQMEVWDRVKRKAKESKQSLEAHRVQYLFVFPEMPDI